MKNRGSPIHEPTEKTRAEVAALASYGVTQDDIAKFIDIDPKTLRKHYRRELDTSGIKANAAMARRLFKAAESGNVTAMIFWLKTRARWSETAAPQDDDEIEASSITVERRDARIAE